MRTNWKKKYFDLLEEYELLDSKFKLALMINSNRVEQDFKDFESKVISNFNQQKDKDKQITIEQTRDEYVIELLSIQRSGYYNIPLRQAIKFEVTEYYNEKLRKGELSKYDIEAEIKELTEKTAKRIKQKKYNNKHKG